VDRVRANVVTVGSKNESLGANKLATWLRSTGWDVAESVEVSPMFHDFDLTCFSAVFSWKLPALVKMVNSIKAKGEVWIGGPAVSFSSKNCRYVEDATGIAPTTGIDHRFEKAEHDSCMNYFSRGCPAYTPACGFCPVPKIEGSTFTFYPDARPTKMLLDNNLSALPSEYQDHIIDAYRNFSGKVDANSGFEPHSFSEETLARWSTFPLMYWRFGYDDLTEREQALTMLDLLLSSGVSGRRIQVYTLIGNESVADSISRCREVIRLGAEPRPQRLRPLDWLGGDLPCRHDWTEKNLIATQRYFALPQIWKTVEMKDFYYQKRYPFRDMGVAV